MRKEPSPAREFDIDSESIVAVPGTTTPGHVGGDKREGHAKLPRAYPMVRPAYRRGP